MNNTGHHLPFTDRFDYKKTWEGLSDTIDSSMLNIAGHIDMNTFDITGQHTVSILEEYIGIHSNDIVLEIGCGIGRVGKFLAKKCSKWIGTDISANMIKYAQQYLKDISNVEFIELPGLDKIPESSIDVVYCTVVFMHLLEWDRFEYVKEAFRILKSGGRCFFDNADITSTNGWNLFTSSYVVPAKERTANLGMVSSGDELETYGKKAGFIDVKIHRWDDCWVGMSGVKP